ncbi:hypothetical protein BT96DRAFT_988888 [Gymnopus androsaceus JB14]|uniref:Uncharacterized protein n=1 Tax=Gymnopus androsaceus JB14 TaxID=1447944 RepID=A0A6A4I2U4_9AGAR|nr:hypothetical protein BT96DRAFT_988888 [Gymnopus androsaceus JB14]
MPRKRKATELELLQASAPSGVSDISGYHVTHSHHEFNPRFLRAQDFIVKVNVWELFIEAQASADLAWRSGLEEEIEEIEELGSLPCCAASPLAPIPGFNPLSNLLQLLPLPPPSGAPKHALYVADMLLSTEERKKLKDTY